MRNLFRDRCEYIKERMKTSDIFQRVLTGAFWSIFGTASAKLIVLCAGIICANILGSGGFGKLGIVRSTINMFVIFGTAGLGITATKYISQYKKTDPEMIQRILSITTLFTLIMAGIIAVVVLFFAPYIAISTLQDPSLCGAMRVGAFLLFCAILNGAFNGILSGFERFKSIALNTFKSSCLEGVFIICGAYFYGVLGAVLGYGIGVFSLLLFNVVSVRNTLQKNSISYKIVNFRRQDISVLYKFSLPAALSSFLVAPSYWVIRALLINNDGFEELGVYEAADQWRIIILFVPSALSNIVLPILSGFSKGEERDYKKALKMNLLLNVSVAFFLSTMIALFSGLIMKSYGEGFENRLPLILIACSTVFSSFAAVIGVSIVSRGKMWMSLFFNMMWSIQFIGLTYLFLRMGYGAVGASMALLLSYIIHSIYQSLYLFNLLRKGELG